LVLNQTGKRVTVLVVLVASGSQWYVADTSV
jgi:hypothetical protein